LRTSWSVDVLNSVIFNSFHNWVEFGTILEGLWNLGGGWTPQTPSVRHWCYMRLCGQRLAPDAFSQGKYNVVHQQIKLDNTRLYTWNDLVQKTKTHVRMRCQKKKKITKLSVKRLS